MAVYKTDKSQEIKMEMYHVLKHLAHFGDNSQMSAMAIQQRLLEECLSDASM
jgi:hypothetical protein